MKRAGNVMFGAGMLLLLAADVLSVLGAVKTFTAPAGDWLGPERGVLVAAYLSSSLLAGIFGALAIGLGLRLARPRRLWKLVTILGIVYCLPMLSQSIFLAVKGHSWLTDLADVMVFAVYLVPGLAAVVEGLVLRKPPASSSEPVEG